MALLILQSVHEIIHARISIIKIVVIVCAGGGISNYGDLHPSDMALDTGVVFAMMCFDFLFK